LERGDTCAIHSRHYFAAYLLATDFRLYVLSKNVIVSQNEKPRKKYRVTRKVNAWAS